MRERWLFVGVLAACTLWLVTPALVAAQNQYWQQHWNTPTASPTSRDCYPTATRRDPRDAGLLCTSCASELLHLRQEIVCLP